MSEDNNTSAFLFYGTLSGIALGVLAFVNYFNHRITSYTYRSISFASDFYYPLAKSILGCSILGLLTALCIKGVLFKKNINHRISSGFYFLLLLIVWIYIFGSPGITLD